MGPLPACWEGRAHHPLSCRPLLLPDTDVDCRVEGNREQDAPGRAAASGGPYEETEPQLLSQLRMALAKQVTTGVGTCPQSIRYRAELSKVANLSPPDN